MTSMQAVLVVDDDPMLCRVMAQALAEGGYHVFTAGTGEDALVMACQLGGRLGLVVTDIRMPEMDGPELASHLAELNPPPRILFVSGYGTVTGGDLPCPLLAKPFTPQQLVSRVRAMIGRPELARASGPQHR